MEAATVEISPRRIDLRRRVLAHYFDWLTLVEADTSLFVLDLGAESICFFDVLHKIDELHALERHALAMFVTGHTTRQIAEDMNISWHTAQNLLREAVGNLIRLQENQPVVSSGPGRGRRLSPHQVA